MVFHFGPFELDTVERRLLNAGEPVQLRAKVFDTLCLLVENHDHLLRKEKLIQAIWPNSVVEDNNLDHNISHLRRILGEGTNGLRFIETVPRQGYRFVAEVRAILDSNPSNSGKNRPGVELEDFEQEIRFFTTDDGVQIAYSTCGKGPVLVKAANWLNHLQFEAKSPLWRDWLSFLSGNSTLVRYDERGNGLSSWNITNFSFGAWCRDLEKLIHTLKLERFSLLGISQGASVAVWYAAKYPERVERLILYGGYTRPWDRGQNTKSSERRNALTTLIKTGWGNDNPAFRQLFTTLFMPDATSEHVAWFNELQRVSTSPENAVKFMHAFAKVDAVDLLPKVKCPTLVIHSDTDEVIPIAEGRFTAARIPGAQFVELPSKNHIIIHGEPAWELFIREVSRFMGWENAS